MKSVGDVISSEEGSPDNMNMVVGRACILTSKPEIINLTKVVRLDDIPYVIRIHEDATKSWRLMSNFPSNNLSDYYNSMAVIMKSKIRTRNLFNLTKRRSWKSISQIL